MKTTKEELLQLLQDFSVQDAEVGSTYEQRVILDNDFEKLAEVLLTKIN